MADDLDALIAQTPAAQADHELDALIGSTPSADLGPGKGEAFLRGGGQGVTFGFGDELAAAANAGLGKVLPESMGGFDVRESKKSFADHYKQARDAFRADNAAAEKAHGKIYGTGNIVGGVVGSALLPELRVMKGLGLGARVANGAVNGLSTGGLIGAGSSKGETAGQVALDTAIGSGVGLTLGAGAPVVAKGLSMLPEALKALALRQAKSALGATAKRTISDPAAEQALKTGVVKWLGTTKGAANRLEQQQASLGGKYGSVVEKLANAGVEGPEASELSQALLDKAVNEQATNPGSTLPELFMKHAEDVEKTAGESGRIPLKNALTVVRNLQGRSKYNNTLDTEINDARKAIAYEARDALERAVEQQGQKAGGETQALAEQFAPLKRQLKLSYEAGDLAERAHVPHAMSVPNLLFGLMAGGGHAAHGAGAAGIASGAGAALAAHGLRSLGPSTAARAAYAASNALESKPAQWLAEQLDQNAIAQALRRGFPAASIEGGEQAYAPQ